jgi:hypothetical protein
VTDSGIDFNEDVHDVQIVLTSQPTMLAGIVTDASGSPVARPRWAFSPKTGGVELSPSTVSWQPRGLVRMARLQLARRPIL